MSNIKILDPFTANQIAAGEVVERPASVVKELCENSLDAGASTISIHIQNGGIASISVIDNGCGMDKDDAKTAFLRHATSKLNTVQDFDTIQTMGFRGEALASIAAVSKVTLKTKQIGSPEGTLVRIEDGNIIEHAPVGCTEGSGILIESLFYNTPARYKFLKKDSTEGSYITDIIERFILARPDVSFRYIQNNQEILHSPGNNDLRSAIFSIYGKTVTQGLIPVSFQSEHITISGFIGKPEICKNTRQYQSIFINHRYVKSKTISAALEEGYKTLLMKGKFAFCVLNLSILPALVDVNVHPQKTEVKFWNDQEVFLAVLHAVKEAISSGLDIAGIVHDEKSPSAEKINETKNEIKNEIKSETSNFVTLSEIIEKKDAMDGNNVNAGKDASIPYPAKGEDTAPKPVILNETPALFQPTLDHYANMVPDPNVTTVQNASAIQKVASDQNMIPDQRVKASEPQQTAVTVNELANAKYIGTLFQTYLLLELDQNMIVIDQHAAHERILFEKLVAGYRNHVMISQPLLDPVILELTAHEIVAVKDQLDILTRLGFECEIFGNQSIIFRAVPFDDTDIDLQQTIKSILDSLPDKIQYHSEEEISSAFYTIACKAAVKANDLLDPIEIEHLLSELQKIPNPTHCPHGRPVLLKMSKYEIEKSFKRIVTG